ncbi:hypothetical protein H5410_019003 [Solanum commersonii]|uniref:Uncharacterized protein n=1 Tax=Solanum commersonii TaxID=4109 RepID=A0A9J6A4F3_SOLCO|nr:hypothetical protein H5410_019003 [Solanum commersonii]
MKGIVVIKCLNQKYSKSGATNRGQQSNSKEMYGMLLKIIITKNRSLQDILILFRAPKKNNAKKS